MGSSDPMSVGLRAPSTWTSGVRVAQGEWGGEPFSLVGNHLSEFEFQRYRPRRVLTDLLAGFDLVQIVAGAPAWGWIARDLTVPVALQVATLAAVERRAVLDRGSAATRAWRSLMTRVTTRLERRGLDCVDAVFVENQWMYDGLRRELSPEKVIFASPGVDTTCFSPAEAEPEAPGQILCVGRMADARKRADVLFDAYALLCEQLPEAPPLCIAGGSGPPEECWARAKERGISDRIHYRANVTTEELAAIYRDATVFALSSDEEGLGIVILEAMASGLAVVSTDCGGPSTSVIEGETGLLVPRGSPEALAGALRDLLTDPARRGRLARAGRERAVQEFSLEATGRRFLEWYDCALAAPSAAKTVAGSAG
jgi:glycosyltransferase involved in cell wall biosynthesis